MLFWLRDTKIPAKLLLIYCVNKRSFVGRPHQRLKKLVFGLFNDQQSRITYDQNSELQVDAVEKAGAEQVFEEKFTGKVRERPELSQCLRKIRKSDILVVWKLDRLARSLKDLVEILQDLHNREIGFKSLTESIDTTSSGGRLVFHIFGALAEFEHDLIRERTIAGLNEARTRGRKGGRKSAMSEADVKKAAAMLLDPNITKKEMAGHFGVARTTLNASFNRLEKG
ncbi:MAG: recombinase family protein [Thalassospira sp.]|nr:recombinase family protein [Thalassospira sp.]